MAYQKILIDNISCSRRFHVTFDSETTPKSQVKLSCPYCDKVIFEATDHPAVVLARQENLVQTAKLSDRLVRGCEFRDSLTEQTIPSKKNEAQFLYHSKDKI